MSAEILKLGPYDKTIHIKLSLDLNLSTIGNRSSYPDLMHCLRKKSCLRVGWHVAYYTYLIVWVIVNLSSSLSRKGPKLRSQARISNQYTELLNQLAHSSTKCLTIGKPFIFFRANGLIRRLVQGHILAFFIVVKHT